MFWLTVHESGLIYTMTLFSRLFRKSPKATPPSFKYEIRKSPELNKATVVDEEQKVFEIVLETFKECPPHEWVYRDAYEHPKSKICLDFDGAGLWPVSLSKPSNALAHKVFNIFFKDVNEHKRIVREIEDKTKLAAFLNEHATTHANTQDDC
jgi:hypothetical protein